MEVEAQIESGTVVSWDVQSGTGRILADTDDQALFVHQVDLSFSGEGARRLPLWHQCDFVRSLVNGSHVACKVSRSNRRLYHFEKTGEETKPTVSLPTAEGSSDVRNLLHEKLKHYECVVTTNESIDKGKIYYFHGEFRYGVIIPDYDLDKRIFADASSFKVLGSYLNVRKGVCVEFQTGKNKDGEEVAAGITGTNRQPIDHTTRVESLTTSKVTGKRKNKRKGANATKKLKQSVSTTIKEPKPVIPDGKNPISIFYEFANSCNPKKTPSIKLVSQNTRSSGMVSDFTFESRLDDKPIAQGRAKTKKDAKTYAAWFALEALEKESSVYKQEISRIKQGIPSVKKQMRSFTKRKWRGKFGSTTRQASYSGSNTSFMYSPAIVVPQIAPATVSLTTYNTVSQAAPTFVSAQNPTTTTTNKSYLNQSQSSNKTNTKMESSTSLNYSAYDNSNASSTNNHSNSNNSTTNSTFPSNSNQYSGAQVQSSYQSYPASAQTSYYAAADSTGYAVNTNRQQQNAYRYSNLQSYPSNQTTTYTAAQQPNQTVNSYYPNYSSQ